MRQCQLESWPLLHQAPATSFPARVCTQERPARAALAMPTALATVPNDGVGGDPPPPKDSNASVGPLAALGDSLFSIFLFVDVACFVSGARRSNLVVTGNSFLLLQLTPSPTFSLPNLAGKTAYIYAQTQSSAHAQPAGAGCHHSRLDGIDS